MKLECLYAPHKWRENETWFNEYADWFVLPFYTLLFSIQVIDSIRTLMTPYLLEQLNLISVISFLILSSGMVLYNLRELSQKVKFFLDLSKPITHERIPLKKPSTKYGIIEKYAKYQFVILLAMYLLLIGR